MKNVIKASLLALAFALPVAANAQNIAVVSLENAILQTELAQEIISKEEGNAVFKDKTSQLEKLSAELKTMAENYQRDEAVLSAEQKQAQQQLMESKQSEGLAIQQQLVNAQQQLRTALVRNNQQIVFQAAQQVAEDEGVDILLNASSVLYMKDVNDITAKVTDNLNQKKDQ